MAEIKTLNGYGLSDEKTREQLKNVYTKDEVNTKIVCPIAYKDFDNGYINLSSTITAIPANIIPIKTADYVYAILPCLAGDVFYITSTGTPSARPYAFLDASRNIILRSEKYICSDEIVTAPENAAFIVYNSLIENTYSLTIVEYVNESVKKIKAVQSEQFRAIAELDSRVSESIADISDAIIVTDLIDDYYARNADGAIVSNGGYCVTDFIDLFGTECSIKTYQNADVSCIAFFNSAKVFVGYYNVNANHNGKTFMLSSVTNLDNIRYVRVSCLKAKKNEFEVVLYKNISKVSEDIANIVASTESIHEIPFDVESTSGYIMTNGTLRTPYAGYNYSKHILVKEGDTVYAKVTASGASAIAMYDTNDTFVNNVIFDSREEYELVAKKDGYAIVSWRNSTTPKPQVYIKKHITDTSVLTAKKQINNASELPSDDLNTFPINTMYSFTFGHGLANAPTTAQGMVYTLCPNTVNENTTVQFFVTTNNVVFRRVKWGSNWTQWISSETPLTPNTVTSDVLRSFDKMIFWGDSLTYGQVYTSNTASRRAYNPYPKIIGKYASAETESYAYSGNTAIQTWTNYNSQVQTVDRGLAFIYLGTNGGLTDTIDSDCADSNYNNWANTNTGCYGKIIKKSQECGYRCVLIKVYKDSVNTPTVTNSVIQKFAQKFGCVVLDNVQLARNPYSVWDDKTGSDTTHYNDVGYSKFAEDKIYQINHLAETELLKLL